MLKPPSRFRPTPGSLLDIHASLCVFVRVRMPPKPHRIVPFTGRPIALVECDVSNSSLKFAKTRFSRLDRHLAVFPCLPKAPERCSRARRVWRVVRFHRCFPLAHSLSRHTAFPFLIWGNRAGLALPCALFADPSVEQDPERKCQREERDLQQGRQGIQDADDGDPHAPVGENDRHDDVPPVGDG